MANKLFLQNNSYLMRISDSDSVTQHLNAFNIVITQLLFIDINIIEEEKCISMLCSFPDSWNNLVVAIWINNTTLKLDDVVATLLSEEMRWKNTKGLTPEAPSVRGRPIIKNKGKHFSGRSKSRGKSRSRSTSLVQSTRRFWTCVNPRKYKKKCKSKGVSTSKDYKETQSTERKLTQDEKGDVYLASRSTQLERESHV